MQQKRKKKDFAKNKRAFDAVFHHYRNLNSIGSIHALNMEKAGGGGSPNPAKPTPLDFRCDVDKIIKKVVPMKHFARFLQVYVFFEGATEIEQEKYADKILGGMRHSFEQRMGEQFHQRKIFPVQGRGYFHSVRRGNPHGHHFKDEAHPGL